MIAILLKNKITIRCLTNGSFSIKSNNPLYSFHIKRLHRDIYLSQYVNTNGREFKGKIYNQKGNLITNEQICDDRTITVIDNGIAKSYDIIDVKLLDSIKYHTKRVTLNILCILYYFIRF